MKPLRIVMIVSIILIGLALGALLVRDDRGETATNDKSGHTEGGAESLPKGPHGGRLLASGSFAAEVTLFERGVPPEFRLYFYEDGKPLDPTQVTARVSLERFAGKRDAFTFRPQDGFLASNGVVAEPHSFRVTVDATFREQSHTWTYDSYEERVVLSPAAAARAGIEADVAGPATLDTRLRLNGIIKPNEDRLAHVLPRFAGVVRDVRKKVGDPVGKGEVMAVVQSNQSLQSYEVRSEVEGTVIHKHVTPGEFVSEGDDLYTVANLDTVWIDLNVYRQDFPRIAVGQPVVLDAGEGLAKAEGRIDYISPFGAANTQTMLARVILPNPNRAWRPGFFVTGEVVVDQTPAAIAVHATALQTLRDRYVVFLKDGNVYQAQPVAIGRRDDQLVEILAGVAPGQQYVARNSFVLKADVGKSGASHDD